MRPRIAWLAVLAPFALTAQTPAVPAPAPPQIITSAVAEVELKPDRAELTFTVESRGATAAKAAAETARKQRDVLDTLRVLGVAAEQMTTSSIEIHAEFVYPGENKPPRIAGYVARNSVRVSVVRIEQTGMLIDAALSKEATGIGSLQFRSSRHDDGRRQALELAVAKAKADAEAMARAAGGSLGTLVELSAEPAYERRMTFLPEPAPALSASRTAMPTPVEAGEIKVMARVMGRWGYVAGR